MIYSYATVYQSAREAAEAASLAPPLPENVANPDDECVQNILSAARRPATLFPDLASLSNVQISYPNYRTYRDDDYTPSGYDPGQFVRLSDRRNVGYPIEVTITYPVQALSPLPQLVPFGDQTGIFTITTTARRTIVGIGRDPSSGNLDPCIAAPGP
ncbi:MAG: hypothetical protein HC914_01930 [Chloroflexaceae bacterium]|nr:hypothetical protein [Chloroflexaceae bacterium]